MAHEERSKRVLAYAEPSPPWWRRHRRLLFLIAVFLVLFLVVKVVDRLGYLPGDWLPSPSSP